jgi:hypothetical protein
MDDLPSEIQLHILSFLSPEDLALRCGLVSRSWNQLTDEASLWLHHLEHQHPGWRIVLGTRGDTPRERFRLMSPHDPSERRDGWCEHDETKGAVCQCCTCRRYHSDQEWDAGFKAPHDIDDYHQEFMAKTYDANVASYGSVVASIATGNVIRHVNETAAVHSLEGIGLLKRRRLSNGVEILSWTDEAHRALRPPLRNGYRRRIEVAYTDALLYSNLKDDHPALCDRLLIDADVFCGAIELSDDDESVDIAKGRTKAIQNGWTAEEFNVKLAKLVNAGWMRRWDDKIVITPALQNAVRMQQ